MNIPNNNRPRSSSSSDRIRLARKVYEGCSKPMYRNLQDNVRSLNRKLNKFLEK